MGAVFSRDGGVARYGLASVTCAVGGGVTASVPRIRNCFAFIYFSTLY